MTRFGAVSPGVSSGKPVSLDLLPDFSAIGDKRDAQTEDERAQAVEMARATLAPYLGGTGQKTLLKQGVLADALRQFAKTSGGGTLGRAGDLRRRFDGRLRFYQSSIERTRRGNLF